MTFFASYPLNGVTSSSVNSSVGPTGSPVPPDATLVGGEDPSGDLVALSVTAGGVLNVAVGSSALPTGAATSANQATEIASLASIDTSLNNVEAYTSSIDSKLANNYGASSGAIRTASQIGNTTGQADFNKGAAGAQTLRVAIVNDQDPVAITGSITATNAAVGLNGAAAPTSSSQGGGIDGGGLLRAISVDASGNQNVNVLASALPSGAATEVTLAALNAKFNSLGQKTMANSAPVVIASDQSAIPVSGTVAVTGVATAANQATEIASLASIDGKIALNYGVATAAIRTAAQVGNASGVADFGAGNSSAQTLRTVLATDQAALTVNVNSGAGFKNYIMMKDGETFTVPAGVTKVTVIGSGGAGGGGGGRGTGTGAGSGGGGGAGGNSIPTAFDLTVVPAAAYVCTIGVGGAGGAGSNGTSGTASASTAGTTGGLSKIVTSATDIISWPGGAGGAAIGSGTGAGVGGNGGLHSQVGYVNALGSAPNWSTGRGGDGRSGDAAGSAAGTVDRFSIPGIAQALSENMLFSGYMGGVGGFGGDFPITISRNSITVVSGSVMSPGMTGYDGQRGSGGSGAGAAGGNTTSSIYGGGGGGGGGAGGYVIFAY